MKKVTLWLLVVSCLIVSIEPVFARAFEDLDYMFFGDRKDIFLIADSVEKLAKQIAQYNKPVFEVKLTKKERQYYDMDVMGDYVPYTSSIIWNKVCAKDKTVVLGIAGKDKKFYPLYFKTADPKFSFAGGIHVGSSVQDLERFLGYKVTKKTVPKHTLYSKKGNIIFFAGPVELESDAEFPIAVIKCENGRITEIFYDGTGGRSNPDGIISKKALDFANKQTRQLGLSVFNTAIFWSMYNK